MAVKILVVDDEQDVEFLFKQKFRKEIRNTEFELYFAFNGNQALDFMSTLHPFDLVMLLSDINMPGMTGLELLRRTKAQFPYLKVIMVTAYGDPKNYSDAQSLGADDFVTKPVDFDSLKERILKLNAAN